MIYDTQSTASDSGGGEPAAARAAPVGAVYDIVHDCGERIVLAGACLEVEVGEIVGICAEPGSGKSLLLEIMSGATEPLTGEVRILGEDLNRKNALAHVAFLSQTSAVDDRLRVWQWLEYRAAVYGMLPENVDTKQVLGRLAIADMVDTHIENLSPGQKKAVAACAVLMKEAKLTLLDNVFAGLGEETSRFLVKTLRERTAQGNAAVITATAGSELAHACDRILKIENGRLREVKQ